MVSSDIENLVSGIRLSSVVPARVTGEDKVHELTNIDLAMKLHYVKGVYFFKSEAVHGCDIYDFKKPMFEWCEAYYPASGRVRRSETGRPFIKCNDSGVRIVEARCDKSLNEWVLDSKDDPSLNDHLVYDHILGPDLGFSPLAFVQFTWFKCGGIAVGLSWSHILGDPFSAANYINMWGHLMTGYLPPLHKMPNNGNYKFPSSIRGKPFSLKIVDPVGDHWLTTNTSKMVTHSFQITSRQIQNLVSKICESKSQTVNLQPFDAISSIIWKILAKIRGDLEPKIITVVKNGTHAKREGSFPSNDQVISAIEANFRVANADPLKLAKLIAENKVDERKLIEEIMREEDGKSDVIIYGANLTFVNLEEANVYGLELKGHKPVFAYYSIGGVGDKGVILILPGPKNDAEEYGGGRTVTVTLPEHHIGELRNVLKKEWNI